MEMPGSESFSEVDQTLSQLPPKKRPSDRGQSVDDETPENENLQTNSNSNDSSKITQNQPKPCIDQEPQNVGLGEESNGESSKSPPPPPPAPLATSPSQCPIARIDEDPQNVGLNEESQGESSKPPSPPPTSPPPFIRLVPLQRPISCKFCDQKFATTQALGGHQNAHKKERELQKAMEAANDLRLNSLPGILSRPLRGPLLGRRPPYHPYNGFQAARPVYSHPNTSYTHGQTGVPHTIQDYMAGSSIKPADASFHGWTARYAPPIGPVGRSNGPTYFNPFAGSGSTSFLPAMANQARANLAAGQSMESTSLGLSLKDNEFGKMGLPPNPDDHHLLNLRQNDPTELDLELKL